MREPMVVAGQKKKNHFRGINPLLMAAGNWLRHCSGLYLRIGSRSEQTPLDGLWIRKLF